MVLLTRLQVSLKEVQRLMITGCLLSLGTRQLSFDREEIRRCLEETAAGEGAYTAEDVERVYSFTEGWAMAVKMMGNYRQLPVSRLMDPFGDGEEWEDGRLDALFQYLARDILAGQSQDMKEFLLRSALLDLFNSRLCRDIFGDAAAGRHIDAARRQGLFVVETSLGFYRYHHLFQEFLRREAEKYLENISELQRRAGSYYRKQGDNEAALRQFVQAGCWEEARQCLGSLALELIYSGRSRLLARYLEYLPLDWRESPDILLALGEEERYSNNYQQALLLYKRTAQLCRKEDNAAGVSRAYRHMAEVYLDTIQPLEAQLLLRRSYKVLPASMKKDKAELLELMTENLVNQGRTRQAQRYLRLASRVYYPFALQDRNNLRARILVRTGQPHRALQLLRGKDNVRQSAERISYSFRESLLIISLCHVYLGQREPALVAAREAVAAGEKLRSPFVIMMGYVRMGHGLLGAGEEERQAAWDAYEKATLLSRELNIVRLQGEILQGKGLWHALRGNWPVALECGQECISIAERFRDWWFAAVAWHSLGMSAVLCNCYQEAEGYLQRAGQLFARCGDDLGRTASAWWDCWRLLQQENDGQFRQAYYEYSRLCRENQAYFLNDQPSLLGNIGGFSVLGLEEQAKRLKLDGAPAELIAGRTPLFAEGLKIQTLGSFRVWRNECEITGSQWRRESSRQLLRLLLSHRQCGLHKEIAMVQMWPEDDFASANTRFKVALSNLLNVLDPGRGPRTPSRFIIRKGSTYWLNEAVNIELDAPRFEQLVGEAVILLKGKNPTAETLLREAVALYQGDYLEEAADESSFAERERLRKLYFRALEYLSRLCIRKGNYDEGLHWAEAMLSRDNCWERAYQLQLLCYHHLQNQVMLVRTYQRCCSVFAQELGIRPSSGTRELYERLTES
ncbi:BTAD domain-containing putative transcriptional regulator [Sporomusa malonica]|uniref:BTAD domain-containing putative transcriptional regulator n=1 Tax=Sporomusa malonica TaxID=112901 RepID=UPI00352B01F5